MDHRIKAKSYGFGDWIRGFWLIYFVLSIGVIGATLAFGVVVPLYILGIIWSPATRAGDWVMCRGIRLLMSLQPWLSADIELDIPHAGKGCLLVSNHRSHLDAFILLSRVQGIRILAKSSLFMIPFLGILMRLSKQIPTRRGDIRSFLQAMQSVRARAASGDVVHVFPEMTRCSPGYVGTQEFLVAPFHAAMQGGLPVVPIVFEGTDAVWPKSAWKIHYRRPVRVRALTPLDPAQFKSSDELMIEARRRIQEALVS
jgi:1-acyl-sn-glycerol-3-phosphate acyltransferase